ESHVRWPARIRIKGSSSSCAARPTEDGQTARRPLFPARRLLRRLTHHLPLQLLLHRSQHRGVGLREILKARILSCFDLAFQPVPGGPTCNIDRRGEPVESGDRPSPALRPANLPPLPHFSFSSATSLPKSVGEPVNISLPSSAIRPFTAGSASTALTSRLSRST